MIVAEKLRASLQRASSIEEVMAVLARGFGELSTGPATVRGFRDQFTSVLRHVRGGRVGVIGGKGEDPVVVISLRELAGLVAGTRRTASFADALAARPGFKAVHMAAPLRQRARGRQAYGLAPAETHSRPAARAAE